MIATPMMECYRKLKATLPQDTLLLWRLGDFYELFDEDARVAARLLDLVFTKRNGTPMCGIPYHAKDPFVRTLVDAGKCVAIAEVVEKSIPRKLPRWQIVNTLTPK